MGAPLYDFAFLADGFEVAMLDQLYDAYRQEAGAGTLDLPGTAEMKYIVNCLCLQRIISVLSGALDKQLPRHGIAKLIDRAEQISGLIMHRS